MGGEPKRRHSRARKGKRRASISLAIPNAIVCANCGVMTKAHAVCKKCVLLEKGLFSTATKEGKK